MRSNDSETQLCVRVAGLLDNVGLVCQCYRSTFKSFAQIQNNRKNRKVLSTNTSPYAPLQLTMTTFPRYLNLGRRCPSFESS
jgi:hypothetical protein